MVTGAFMEKYRSILMFGPPGSGKGTQGKLVSNVGGHFHLSSGDIFRGLTPESEEGKLYYSYASKGHLVPDDVTIQIFKAHMKGLVATNQYHPGEQLLVLDGIPRTLVQAGILDDYIDVKKIILLEIEQKQELIKRLVRRATIEKRQDDMDENVLKTRLEVYEKETFDVLNHYSEDLIARFNGEQAPVYVLRDILITLSDLINLS